MKRKPSDDSMDAIRRRDAQWKGNMRDGNASRAATDRRILLELVAEHDHSFDLRWKADMRAIKRWQEAHPGKELTWPDHADLVVWLLGLLDDRIQKCAATRGTDPPQDCDAPFCGCNPEWSKVIQALQESGWQSPQEIARMRLELAAARRELNLSSTVAGKALTELHAKCKP